MKTINHLTDITIETENLPPTVDPEVKLLLAEAIETGLLDQLPGSFEVSINNQTQDWLQMVLNYYMEEVSIIRLAESNQLSIKEVVRRILSVFKSLNINTDILGNNFWVPNIEDRKQVINLLQQTLTIKKLELQDFQSQRINQWQRMLAMTLEYYFTDTNMEKLGEKYEGISKSRVRQLIDDTLVILKKNLHDPSTNQSEGTYRINRFDASAKMQNLNAILSQKLSNEQIREAFEHIHFAEYTYLRQIKPQSPLVVLRDILSSLNLASIRDYSHGLLEELDHANIIVGKVAKDGGYTYFIFHQQTEEAKLIIEEYYHRITFGLLRLETHPLNSMQIQDIFNKLTASGLDRLMHLSRKPAVISFTDIFKQMEVPKYKTISYKFVLAYLQEKGIPAGLVKYPKGHAYFILNQDIAKAIELLRQMPIIHKPELAEDLIDINKHKIVKPRSISDHLQYSDIDQIIPNLPKILFHHNMVVADLLDDNCPVELVEKRGNLYCQIEDKQALIEYIKYRLIEVGIEA